MMLSATLSHVRRYGRPGLLTILTLIAGCESRDQRLVEYAARASAQQARQNEHLAEQSRSVARQSEQLASTAHHLVEQDAAARRELLQTHQQLQRQLLDAGSELDRQRQQMATERKAVAAAALRDPVIAQAIIDAGLMLAALLPLILTAYALSRLPDQGPAEQLLLDSLCDNTLPWATPCPSEPPPSPLPDGVRPHLTNPPPSDAEGRSPSE